MLTRAQADSLRTLLERVLDEASAGLRTVTTDPVVAVAHAWFVRAAGSLRATLLLADEGHHEVAAPLVRSAMEHAVGVAWIHRAGLDGLLSLARGQRKWAEDVQRAVKAADSQEHGPDRQNWSDEMKEALEAVVDQELPKSKLDVQLHHLARFESVGAFDLFVAWLSETGYSHATDASAQPYVVSEGDRYLLLAGSRRDEGTLVMRCAAVAVMACHAMAEVLGSDVWAERVSSLDREMGALLRQARAEGWASEIASDDWRTRFAR